MTEINYAFRERMLEVHKPHRRMPFAVCKQDQIEITADWVICLPTNPDRVLYNAARDLEDYFAVSMELSLRVQLGGKRPAKVILYQYDNTLTDGRYRLAVTENQVVLAGGDSRAAAQAGYFLEDLMNLEEGPFLTLQDTLRTPLYTTRMVHSGYGLDQYPDNHMKVIAHTGINALLVFVKGLNETPFGYQDFNDLIYRAAGYGLDVYVYPNPLNNNFAGRAQNKRYHKPKKEREQKRKQKSYSFIFKNKVHFSSAPPFPKNLFTTVSVFSGVIYSSSFRLR